MESIPSTYGPEGITKLLLPGYEYLRKRIQVSYLRPFFLPINPAPITTQGHTLKNTLSSPKTGPKL